MEMPTNHLKGGGLERREEDGEKKQNEEQIIIRVDSCEENLDYPNTPPEARILMQMIEDPSVRNALAKRALEKARETPAGLALKGRIRRNEEGKPVSLEIKMNDQQGDSQQREENNELVWVMRLLLAPQEINDTLTSLRFERSPNEHSVNPLANVGVVATVVRRVGFDDGMAFDLPTQIYLSVGPCNFPPLNPDGTCSDCGGGGCWTCGGQGRFW